MLKNSFVAHRLLSLDFISFFFLLRFLLVCLAGALSARLEIATKDFAFIRHDMCVCVWTVVLRAKLIVLLCV